MQLLIVQSQFKLVFSLAILWKVCQQPGFPRHCPMSSHFNAGHRYIRLKYSWAQGKTGVQEMNKKTHGYVVIWWFVLNVECFELLCCPHQIIPQIVKKVVFATSSHQTHSTLVCPVWAWWDWVGCWSCHLSEAWHFSEGSTSVNWTPCAKRSQQEHHHHMTENKALVAWLVSLQPSAVIQGPLPDEVAVNPAHTSCLSGQNVGLGPPTTSGLSWSPTGCTRAVSSRHNSGHTIK